MSALEVSMMKRIGELNAEIKLRKAELTDCKAEADRFKAEVERLRASSFVTAVPVQHYERVVKAGDAMLLALNKRDDIFDNSDKDNAIADWNAAKDGKPSV